MFWWRISCLNRAACEAMASPQAEVARLVASSKKRVRETLPTSSSNAQRHNCDLDIELLDCPICTEHLFSPVYQCQNGHPLCSACRVRIRRCPSCSQPLGTTRCLLAEKIMDSLRVRCLHASHGCTQMLKYNMREEHITHLCEYRPCPCPVRGCRHESPKHTLPLHLREKHNVATVSLLLNTTSRRSGGRLLFKPQTRYMVLKSGTDKKVQLLIHREVIDTLGERFFCTSLGDHAMKYDLKVQMNSMENFYTAMVSASAKDIRWRESWKRDVLVFSHGNGKSDVWVSVCLHDDNNST